MLTEKPSYATSSTLACTLAALPDSAASGQSSAAADNTVDLADDARCCVKVQTSASALGNDKACYVYLYEAEDGTNYSSSAAEGIDGTNKAVTLDSPTNLLGPIPIACPSSSGTYRVVFSVKSVFGGAMPRKWGVFVRNRTGQALAGGSVSYTPIQYTAG